MGFWLKTCRVCHKTVHELKWCGANGQLVARVIGEGHGRQEFLSVQSMVMQIRAEILIDSLIEVFNPGIALRMGRSSFGVLDIQDSQDFGRQFVDEFLSSVGMDLCWWCELIDPVIQNHLSHCGGLLVWNGHNHSYLGKTFLHAEHVFVVGRQFECSIEIHVGVLIGLHWYRQVSQRGKFCVALAGPLAAGAALDMPGDVIFQRWPPPRRGNLFLGPFNGTVPGQAAAMGLLQDV